MPDLGVYSKIKEFSDYQKAEQEFQLRRQLAAQKLAGGDAPAALQLANEYQKRIAAGDVQGANLIAQFAKTADKGIGIGSDGTYQPLPGYAPSIGAIEEGKQSGKNQSDLAYKPAIAGGEANARNTSEKNFAAPIAEARKVGDAAGTAKGNIEKKYINAPQLETYLSEAEKLLPNATSGGAATLGRDALAFAGSATKGSEADSQLNVIGGALTMGVPRMEGPQSDKDALLYKQAAGDLANSKLPRETRQAAVKIIRGLNQKYMPSGGEQRSIVRKQFSPSTRKTKIIYSDGAEEIIDAQ